MLPSFVQERVLERRFMLLRLRISLLARALSFLQVNNLRILSTSAMPPCVCPRVYTSLRRLVLIIWVLSQHRIRYRNRTPLYCYIWVMDSADVATLRRDLRSLSLDWSVRFTSDWSMRPVITSVLNTPQSDVGYSLLQVLTVTWGFCCASNINSSATDEFASPKFSML